MGKDDIKNITKPTFNNFNFCRLNLYLAIVKRSWIDETNIKRAEIVFILPAIDGEKVTKFENVYKPIPEAKRKINFLSDFLLLQNNNKINDKPTMQ